MLRIYQLYNNIYILNIDYDTCRSRALLILCSGAFVVMFQGLISSARQPGYTVPVEIMDCDKRKYAACGDPGL